MRPAAGGREGRFPQLSSQTMPLLVLYVHTMILMVARSGFVREGH
jgi:hypothetical protein